MSKKQLLLPGLAAVKEQVCKTKQRCADVVEIGVGCAATAIEGVVVVVNDCKS